MVVASMRAFCSSQNCTVRNSSMRLSSSTGSSVGAIHCPTLGIAALAFFTNPCRNSNPGTSLVSAASDVAMVASA